ncbi:MAG: hypothetical protein H8E89_06680 [Candidatus Nitrosopelagicus sp.]|nr:hypothetical protein [Candidatus Nitrosopelagicus sp.]
MKIICVHCGKSFEGKNTKFCSQGCRDSYIVAIDKRTREAVKDDPSHTTQMS